MGRGSVRVPTYYRELGSLLGGELLSASMDEFNPRARTAPTTTSSLLVAVRFRNLGTGSCKNLIILAKGSRPECRWEIEGAQKRSSWGRIIWCVHGARMARGRIFDYRRVSTQALVGVL